MIILEVWENFGLQFLHSSETTELGIFIHVCFDVYLRL